MARERAYRAAHARGELLIGAAWPWSIRGEGMYWRGMKLAVDELNAEGGILGRRLRVLREDDRESVNEGRAVAQRFADNPDVVAVIGHLNSHVTIPAAAIYEAAGLLMLTPASTSPELMQKGFRHVFRSVNNDERVARHMAGYACKQSYRRIALCYVRNAYGRGLANAFERHALAAGLQVVDRQSYDPAALAGSAGFQHVLDTWKDMAFDAIFLAGMAPQAGDLLRQIRGAGIEVPVLGGDALDTAELVEAAGGAAEGVVAASFYHPDNPRPEVQRFNEQFLEAYARPPDAWAARGYEAVRLLAGAMERAGSAVPGEVAKAFRAAGPWRGVGGMLAFDERGEAVGRPLVTVTVRGGRFAFLEEQMHVPGCTLERP